MEANLSGQTSLAAGPKRRRNSGKNKEAKSTSENPRKKAKPASNT